jgi:NAD+ kinase
MKTFRICKKLNYETETEMKKIQVDHLIQYIQQQMLHYGFIEAKPSDKTIDYVFSIGGDGTMLHTMRNHIAKKSIIIGINAGNVGFLTPYNMDDIFTSDIFSLIDETTQPRIEKRSILCQKFHRQKSYAVNDFAITPFGPNDVLDFSVEIEHKGMISKAGHYRANALVISGPCGSTAYNMNAGGAIVDPVVKCMQMVMVAPTTLGTRPIIISNQSIIHIKTHKTTKIYGDGVLIEEFNPKDNPFTFSISMMKQESNILVPKDWNFFSILSKKLHWNNGKDIF